MTESGKWTAQSIFRDLKAPTISKLAIIISQAVLIPPFVSIMSFLCTKGQIILILCESTIFGLNKGLDGFMAFLHNLHEIVFLQEMLFRDQAFITCTVVLSICAFYLVLLIAMSCYLYRTIYKSSMPSVGLMTFWSIAMKIQIFLAFYPINLISAKALSLSTSDSQNFSSTAISSHAITILSLCVIILNSIWSLLITILFTIKIKAKDILSAKTSRPDLADLFFKFMMPYLWIFGVYSETLSIVILLINLFYCTIKVWFFFSYLPYYSVPLLKVDGFFKALVTSFASAGILYRIISYQQRYSEGLHLLVLLWIVLLCCYGILIYHRLNVIFTNIFLHPTKLRNPYHLIHYFEIFKSFERYSTPGLAALKTKNQYLTYISAIRDSEISNLLPSEASQGWNIKSQDLVHQYFYKKNLTLLESAIKKHPNVVLLKIILAYYYKKFEGLWPLMDDILDSSSKSSFFMRNSVYLVKLSILSRIKPQNISQTTDQTKSADSQRRKLEIRTYLDLIESWKRVKASITEQLKLQTDFWKDFQSQKPDFFRLKELAKSVYSKSAAIKPLATQYKAFSDQGFLEPLLTLGLYFCFTQNGLELGQKLILEYSRNKTLNKSNDLHETSITVNEYILESIYLAMSVSPHQLGIILDCSGKIKNTLGLEKDALVGKSINSLMPLIYAKSHDDFLRLSYKNEEQTAHKEVQEVLILSHENSVISCRIDLAINYLPKYGICYSALLKPNNGKTRIVIIQDDGMISTSSLEFQQDIGIQQNNFDEGPLNIFDYCPDLRKTLKKFRVPASKALMRAVSFLKNSKSDTHTSSFQAKLSSFTKKSSELSNEEAHPDKETLQKVIQTEVFESELVFLSSDSQFHRKNRIDIDEPIIYKAEIKKLTFQNYHVIELKMERINQLTIKTSPTRGGTRQTTTFSKAEGLYTNAESQYTVLHSPKTETVRMDSSEGLLALQSPNLSQKVTFLFPDQSTNKFQRYESETGMLVSPKIQEKSLSVASVESITEISNIDATQRKPQNSSTPLNPKICNSEFSSKENRVLNHRSITKHIIPPYDYIESHLLKETLGEGYADKSTSNKLDNVSGIRAYKLAKRIIESKKLKPSTWAYTLLYVFVFSCLVAFLVSMNVYISNKSKDIKTTGAVLTNAYFRNLWTKYSNQETRIYIAVVENIYPFLLPISIQANFKAYETLSVYNQNLKQSLNSIGNNIEVQFFKQNVRLYEEDAYKNWVLLSIDDTFQAIDKIINKGLTNANKPVPSSSYLETDFIFENSFNDLLIVSEALISEMKNRLFGILQTARTNLTTFLIMVICILGMFFIASFFFIRNSSRESQHFMEVLFGIPLQDIKNTGASLIKFKELIETEGNNYALLQVFRLTPSNHVKGSDQQEYTSGIGTSRKKVFREASMKIYNLRNYLTFGALFVGLGLMIAFSMIYYFQAFDRISSMKAQHISMYSTLQYANAVTLSSLETQALIMGYNTSKIKNLPVTEVLSEEIETLKGVATLQESLQDENGVLSQKQHDILFNISCDMVYSENYNIPASIIVIDCNAVSKGLGRVGLIDVLSNLASQLVQFQTGFINGPKDAATIKSDYNTYFDTVLHTVNTASTLLLMSFEVTTAEFVSLIRDLENKSLVLAWVALIFSIVLGIIIWRFVIKNLLEKELERKKILALVPIRLILPNYGIKKFILDLPK